MCFSFSAGGENLSDDVEQLFELTRIIVMVLAGLLPNLVEPKSQGPFPSLRVCYLCFR